MGIWWKMLARNNHMGFVGSPCDPAPRPWVSSLCHAVDSPSISLVGASRQALEAAGATDESDDLGLLAGAEDNFAEGKEKLGDGSSEIGDAQKVTVDWLHR